MVISSRYWAFIPAPSPARIIKVFPTIVGLGRSDSCTFLEIIEMSAAVSLPEIENYIVSIDSQ